MVSHVGRNVREIVLRLCEDAATPRATTVAILLRHEEWDQLASLEVDPALYDNADRLRRDAAVTSLLRKCQDLPTTIDRRAKAVESFWGSESQCYQSNERLSPYLFGGGDERIDRVLRSMRKKVARILGPVPDFLTEARFGPGATYADKGTLATVPDKMSSRPTLTPSSFPHLLEWVGTAWARACANDGRGPEFVRGNRFTTVPKDCTKDRGICIEPSINVYFQLGIGAHIRERLRRVGIDLRNGQATHERVAREASISGSFATIDLSNASDTICSNLVKLLLPRKWHDLLCSLRSEFTSIDGKWVRLEKFSSMGNGFTFELETLLFLVACLTAVESTDVYAGIPGVDVYVYGDDMIVPTDAAPEVISLLRFLGFTPNVKKTFTTGWFRESCGGDFFRGAAVRPHFLKELPREPQDFIRLSNGIYRLVKRDVGRISGLSFAFRAWLRVHDAIPSSIRRCRGPESLGDLVIQDDRPDLWSTRSRRSIRYFRTYRAVAVRRLSWEHWKPDVVLASGLYGLGDGSRGRVGQRDAGGVTPRNPILSYKLGWTPLS